MQNHDARRVAGGEIMLMNNVVYWSQQPIRRETQSMRINVRVIPRSSSNRLEWQDGQEGKKGTIRARLTAPPVDGAANAALIELLSKQLALPRRNIEIVRGTTGRQKIIEIAGLTLEEVKQRINGL